MESVADGALDLLGDYRPLPACEAFDEFEGWRRVVADLAVEWRRFVAAPSVEAADHHRRPVLLPCCIP